MRRSRLEDVTTGASTGRTHGCTDQCCKREESPCHGAVHTWHFASVIAARYYCSDWGNSGRDADMPQCHSLIRNRYDCDKEFKSQGNLAILDCSSARIQDRSGSNPIPSSCIYSMPPRGNGSQPETTNGGTSMTLSNCRALV